MVHKLNKLLAQAINSNIVHAILSIIVAYSLWSCVSHQLPTSATIRFPIYIEQQDNSGWHATPEMVSVTIHGKRSIIAQLAHARPAIILPAQAGTVHLEPHMIPIPQELTLIDATPIILEVEQIQPIV